MPWGHKLLLAETDLYRVEQWYVKPNEIISWNTSNTILTLVHGGVNMEIDVDGSFLYGLTRDETIFVAVNYGSKKD